MENILVFGSKGMLGHMLLDYLTATGQIVRPVCRNTLFEDRLLDVLNFNQLEEFIKRNRPTMVINCIGLLVQNCEKDPTLAFRLNRDLPIFLSELAIAYDFRFIHASTDCVFSGKDGPYNEESLKDPIDIYGRSKSDGEVFSRNSLTIRTSIIGPELKHEGTGLLHWFLNQKSSIGGYSKVMWGGITTLEWARFISFIIENPLYGIIHLTNEVSISKYELLIHINRIFERNIDIISMDLPHSDKSLRTIRIDNRYRVQSYVEMLEELNTYMKSKDKYTTYNTTI